MSIKRWNARRDATEPDIVSALVRSGAQVIRLDKFDLLVRFRGQLFMLDAKTAKGRPTAPQETMIAQGWPLTLVVTPEDALRAIGALR